MCLVHDLAESIVGDLTPSCGVSKEEKQKREKVCSLCLVVNDNHFSYIHCCSDEQIKYLEL